MTTTTRNRLAGWAVAVAALMPHAAHAAADAARTPADGPRRIVVSIPDRKLAVIGADASVVSVFSVAVGAPATPSHTGTFTIVNRIPNPTYYKPGTVIEPGTNNPLGTRWIGLSEKGYGIHGTDAPGSIGYAKSHGCIRLRNRDIERLFELVRAGDVVELHAERTPEIVQLFGSSLSSQYARRSRRGIRARGRAAGTGRAQSPYCRDRSCAGRRAQSPLQEVPAAGNRSQSGARAGRFARLAALALHPPIASCD